LIFSVDIQDGDLLRHTYRETTHPLCVIYGVTPSSVVKLRTNRRLKKKQQQQLLTSFSMTRCRNVGNQSTRHTVNSSHR